MERIKKILLVLFLVVIIYFCYKLLIIEHDFTYKIDKYKIHEHFYINKTHFYDLTISKDKNNYTYTINKNLSKEKRIIKEIKTYKSNNLVCIIPIYKKDIETNIYCSLDNEQVSNDYLINSVNKDFKTIKNKVKKYKIKYPSTDNKTVSYKKIKVYQNNILDNYNYYVWNYKGIYILNNKKLNYQKILDYDLYDNVMATTIDGYYVIFENTNVNGIENIHYYDSRRNKVKTFKLKEKISKDSYINGVIKNIIYVTDRKEKKEYKLDIKREKIERIDDDYNYIIYSNDKEKKISKSDFFMNDQLFNNNFIKDKKITNSLELYKVGNYYYYCENSRIYKVLDTDKKHRTLLLELNDIKEWYAYDNMIILLADDRVYTYTDNEGLRRIVRNSEFKYNYKNIYKIGKK